MSDMLSLSLPEQYLAADPRRRNADQRTGRLVRRSSSHEKLCNLIDKQIDLRLCRLPSESLRLSVRHFRS